MTANKYVSVLSLFQKDPPPPAAVRIEPELPGKAFVEWLPLYDLQAAASEFGPSVAADCLGWVRVPEGMSVNERCFVSQVAGRAMEPLIPDGAYCMFRFLRPGALSGRVLLLQHHAIWDPDTGGTYTVAEYRAVSGPGADVGDADGWGQTSILLVPRNPAFKAISIPPDQAADLRAVAEFLGAVG